MNRSNSFQTVLGAHSTYAGMAAINATTIPPEKMLPNDDLMFFWYDLDMIEPIRDLEQEFGIVITQSDMNSVTACTIQAVSQLVADKVRQSSRNS